MKKSLFQSSGKFYKGNLHTHTVISDGDFTPEEIKEKYKSRGYSIVAYTDHEIMVPHPDLQDEEFLPLTAIECEFREEFRPQFDPETQEQIKLPKPFLRRKVYHLIYLAPRIDETYYPWPTRSFVWGNAKAYIQDYYVGEKPRSYTPEIANAAIRDAKEHGFLVEYCHPFWSQNRYYDYAPLENVDFVETFNSACEVDGYVLDNSERPFDDFLSLRKHVSPTCSDDAHEEPHIGNAATYIKADSLTYDDVFASLKRGDVFASTGPVFKDIAFDPETKILSVESSDVKMIALTSSRRMAKSKRAEGEETVDKAEFDLSEFIETAVKYNVPEDNYVRITLIDANGKRAYSRGYFLPELINL